MSIASSNTNRNTTKLRIVFLGDTAVGKTSIIDRYTTNRFNEAHNNTVGIDFNVKDLIRNGLNYRLQMWDTAGQQRYRSLIPTYLKNAHFVLFVYDVTKPSTLHNIKAWHKLFVEHQQAPGLVVANKIDMNQYRKVTREEAEELANELRLGYFEVSAKSGKKVNELFEEIVDLVLNQKKKQEELAESSRQKMKELKTIVQNQTEENMAQKEAKKMSLKTKGLQLTKKFKCCQS